MPKRSLAPIIGDKVTLRQLSEGDLSMTMSWRNQDQIRRWFLHSAVISQDQHLGWYAKYSDRDDDLVFIIEDRQNGRPVGQVAIYNIDWNAGTGEFGRLMIGDPTASGRGLARAATETLVAEAFGSWGLRRLDLDVLEDNHVATHIYRRCGFADGGVIKGVRRMSLVSTVSVAEK